MTVLKLNTIKNIKIKKFPFHKLSVKVFVMAVNKSVNEIIQSKQALMTCFKVGDLIEKDWPK